MTVPQQTRLHASCVAVEGRGLLILGPSGSGKSALVLTMMAYGARLVSDDQVLISRKEGRLLADAPGNILGLVEARGVGLLRADPLQAVPLALAVDLEHPEPDRLPRLRYFELLGCKLDLVLGAGNSHLAPALLQYLRSGRQA